MGFCNFSSCRVSSLNLSGEKKVILLLISVIIPTKARRAVKTDRDRIHIHQLSESSSHLISSGRYSRVLALTMIGTTSQLVPSTRIQIFLKPHTPYKNRLSFHTYSSESVLRNRIFMKTLYRMIFFRSHGFVNSYTRMKRDSLEMRFQPSQTEQG